MVGLIRRNGRIDFDDCSASAEGPFRRRNSSLAQNIGTPAILRQVNRFGRNGRNMPDISPQLKGRMVGLGDSATVSLHKTPVEL